LSNSSSVEKSCERLIYKDKKGEDSSLSTFYVVYTASCSTKDILKNVNQFGTIHWQKKFQTNCQTFKKFSLVDNCNFNTWFIKILKFNLDVHFSFSKLSLIQNNGDLVENEQVKVKPFIGNYFKMFSVTLCP